MAWYHLLLDMYGCDPGNLNDKSLMEKAFKRLADFMEMHTIAGPVIVRYVGEENSPSGEGLSGFMIIAESHVSMHTDIRTNYLSIDVYSCKKFDVDVIENYLTRIFKPQKIEKKFIIRGSLKKEEVKAQT